MPRTPVATDAFSAIAEPRRRAIIELLASGGPRSVGVLVEALRLPQPAVSKHLGVLRDAGLVAATRDGRRRLYRLEPREIKAVHEWTSRFERFWVHQLDRIKQRAERTVRSSHGRTLPIPQSPTRRSES